MTTKRFGCNVGSGNGGSVAGASKDPSEWGRLHRRTPAVGSGLGGQNGVVTMSHPLGRRAVAARSHRSPWMKRAIIVAVWSAIIAACAAAWSVAIVLVF